MRKSIICAVSLFILIASSSTVFISDGLFSGGDNYKLFSRSNNVMMTIIEDQLDGTHDLQKGMYSERVYQEIFQKNYNNFNMSVLGVPADRFPKHGCWKNLSSALKSWGIEPEDMPSPFNIFQHMNIDGKTGKMEFTDKVPPPGTHVDLRAEILPCCSERVSLVWKRETTRYFHLYSLSHFFQDLDSNNHEMTALKLIQ